MLLHSLRRCPNIKQTVVDMVPSQLGIHKAKNLQKWVRLDVACYTFYLYFLCFVIPLDHIIDWSALSQILQIGTVAIFVDIPNIILPLNTKNCFFFFLK